MTVICTGDTGDDSDLYSTGYTGDENIVVQ